ncbi:DsbE family thiol:disulfide interchange protein [Methyloceanibacter superfactus]|uniref:DsbE family thiol:disulfide interchange protein n=1 Tax=Methyloceanibacter superfactus TaxID=1774969 RepID=UPI0009F73B07
MTAKKSPAKKTPAKKAPAKKAAKAAAAKTPAAKGPAAKTALPQHAAEPTPPRKRSSWAVALPFLVFAGLAGLFFYALQTGDPSKLPSAMLGKPVPDFTLLPLDGLKADGGVPVQSFGAADLAGGKPTIVNVFASWCVPCLQEHPMLMALANDTDVRLYGINYKDDPASARRFLGRYGNPFDRVGTDASGRVAIDFGVYGVPETYVISGDGKIAYRHVGPLTEQAINEKILPLMQPPAETPAE